MQKGNSCSQKLAITQTSWGGFSVQYYGYKRTFRTHCADPKTDQGLADQGINPYIGLTTNCSDNHNRRFSNFGKFLVSSHVLLFYDIKQKLCTVYEIKCSSMNEKLLYIAQNAKH